MTEHPITPPPELVREWQVKWLHSCEPGAGGIRYFVATRAAQWGADQELEACCEWLSGVLPQFVGNSMLGHYVGQLRATRRPMPPSLKQQALNCLGDIEHGAVPCPSDYDTIRRALDQLPD
jgi:hypothetical protein